MAPAMKRAAKSASASRNQPARETTGKSGSPRTAPNKFKRTDRTKARGKRQKYKSKLKEWLATPADWARFNAWAKINAQPKKIPEPEPIVRPAKPLSQLKKRMKMLSQPVKRPDPSVNCRLKLSIPKAALRAVTTRRTILLALPNIRLVDFGRVYYKISPAALRYEASPRIIELSQPHVIIPDECIQPKTPYGKGLDKERLRKLALTKKLLKCPEHLTEEEMKELFTTWGIKRTALIYNITPWMEFLALPAYKSIKLRKDENAIRMKKMIIEEMEERGKSALAEQKRMDKKESESKRGTKRKASDDVEMTTEEEEGDETEEDKMKAKRRKIEKHAWRFAPSPCKDDPYRMKRSALKFKASSRLEELSKPNIHENKAIRTDPYKIKKSALSASPSERTENLAKPMNPRSPVERTLPREKDEYGRPIFEMPVYGKVLPETKPYKMGECPTKEKKKVAKKRPIDPIIYEQTIDPCIYPDMAKRQKLERKRAEKLLLKRKRKSRRKKKESKKTKDSEKPKTEEAGEKDIADVKETGTADNREEDIVHDRAEETNVDESNVEEEEEEEEN